MASKLDITIRRKASFTSATIQTLDDDSSSMHIFAQANLKEPGVLKITSASNTTPTLEPDGAGGFVLTLF